MSRKFFVTTAIDYTDDVIHIGHAYQKIVADGTRYYLLAIKNLADDGDVSLFRMKEVYNADLANGPGE